MSNGTWTSFWNNSTATTKACASITDCSIDGQVPPVSICRTVVYDGEFGMGCTCDSTVGRYGPDCLTISWGTLLSVSLFLPSILSITYFMIKAILTFYRYPKIMGTSSGVALLFGYLSQVFVCLWMAIKTIRSLSMNTALLAATTDIVVAFVIPAAMATTHLSNLVVALAWTRAMAKFQVAEVTISRVTFALYTTMFLFVTTVTVLLVLRDYSKTVAVTLFVVVVVSIVYQVVGRKVHNRLVQISSGKYTMTAMAHSLTAVGRWNAFLGISLLAAMVFLQIPLDYGNPENFHPDLLVVPLFCFAASMVSGSVIDYVSRIRSDSTKAGSTLYTQDGTGGKPKSNQEIGSSHLSMLNSGKQDSNLMIAEGDSNVESPNQTCQEVNNNANVILDVNNNATGF